MQITKASRKKCFMKLGLSGASGFGKTYSGLLIAYGLTNDWNKICVIDTENGSASLYSHLGEFNTIELHAPYSPERYIQAINACIDAKMEVIIIDSISHEWDGKGGCLEIHQDLGGQFATWAKVTPRHQAFVNAILTSKCHIITTIRRKQDYELVKNDKGKNEPQKVGMKEVTREGFEYELTCNLELINDKHLAKASKDRTGLFMGQPEFVITTETGHMIKKWCDEGISEGKKSQITENQFKSAIARIRNGDKNVIEKCKAYYDIPEHYLIDMNNEEQEYSYNQALKADEAKRKIQVSDALYLTPLP